jgi:hypothetical protein
MAAAVAAAAVLGTGLLIFGGLTRPVPQFGSLARHPDRSLQGTVAYYADQSRCVKLVAAASRPSKTVFCLPKMDVAKAAKEGKEIGPQLVWLPGGRLEVTMFRMMPPTKQAAVPEWRRGWQKIIDVRTGKVEHVPAAKVPSQPNRATHPMISPTGQRIHAMRATWASHWSQRSCRTRPPPPASSA